MSVFAFVGLSLLVAFAAYRFGCHKGERQDVCIGCGLMPALRARVKHLELDLNEERVIRDKAVTAFLNAIEQRNEAQKLVVAFQTRGSTPAPQ